MGEPAEASAPVDATTKLSAAIWTFPNVISMLRIALIGAFTVLLISHQDALAFTTLALAAVSDFADGYLARKWNQVTALGRLLDPAADRLLTVAVVLGLATRDILPWWFVVVVLLRDATVGLALLWGKRKSVATAQVTFMGKLATLLLYIFLPLAYLAYDRWDMVHGLAIVGATASSALYWWAGIGYVRDIRTRVRNPAR